MNIIFNVTVLLVFQILSCGQSAESPKSGHTPDSLQNPKRENTGTTNLVFRSADGGQSWEDISDGLPEPGENDLRGGWNVSFSDDNGFWLTLGNGIYHNKPGFEAPFWTRADLPGQPGNIAPGKNGIYAYHYKDGLFQKAIGTDAWSNVFPEFNDRRVRGVTETADGSVFVSSDKGLFKTTDNGKTWTTIPVGGLGTQVAESDGVMLSAIGQGIMRSADGGQNWSWVVRDGGTGIYVTKINDGFAAITYSTASKTRRVRSSYDGGKTWQDIDQGLPAQLSISSVIQMGDNLFCGHPDGIMKSSDKGKTWKLILPSIGDKVFHLYVSGNVIYAMLQDAGC